MKSIMYKILRVFRGFFFFLNVVLKLRIGKEGNKISENKHNLKGSNPGSEDTETEKEVVSNEETEN